jgi:23S rRNA (uracil1939-C5)-methyltransferase
MKVEAPVSVGDTFDVRITKLGKAGDGLAYWKGYVIFVPGTAIGDEVHIEIEMVKESFSRAKVIDK